MALQVAAHAVASAAVVLGAMGSPITGVPTVTLLEHPEAGQVRGGRGGSLGRGGRVNGGI